MPSVVWLPTALTSRYLPGASGPVTTVPLAPGSNVWIVLRTLRSPESRVPRSISTLCVSIPRLRATIRSRPAGTLADWGVMRYSVSVTLSSWLLVLRAVLVPQPANRSDASAAGRMGLTKASLYIPPGMRTRALHLKILGLLAAVGAVAVGVTSCGTQGIQLAQTNPDYNGAKLFLEHCSGCHTLAVVGAEGSANSIKDRLRTNGPNFNFRKENAAQVLYAIRNGGFSGAIMPENILVGQQAREVAQFLAQYSGLQAPKVPVIENTSQEEGGSTTPAGGTAPASTGASTTSRGK
jgi:mono/diheme cytochrome c family protein